MYYNDPTDQLVVPPADSWKPVWWTPMKTSATLGDDIIQFIESTYKPPRGKNKDQFIKLAEWQKWLLRHIFEIDVNTGYFRYQEVYVQIPRKQGKSLIGSGIGNYFSARGEDGDQIYYVATNFKQANILFEESKRNILNSDLKDIFDVTQYKVKNKSKNIIMEPLTAKPASAQGLGPYISICDELHVWDSKSGTSQAGSELLNALTTGDSDREESMVIEITTAGSNVDGLAHGRYERGKMIAQNALEDDSFGFFCWEAEEQDDIFDPATLRKANPGIDAGYISLERMLKKLNSAAQVSTADFERLNLNKWLKRGDNLEFILGFNWDEIKEESLGSLHDRVKAGERPEITLGFDGSLREDSTGIVAIDVNTKQVEVLYKWEKIPGMDEWYVDLDEVDMAFRKCFQDFDVKKAYCDSSKHQAMVQAWGKEFGGMIVRDMPTNPRRMQPMASQFKNDVYMKQLKHNGDRRFREHITNAVENLNGIPKKETPQSQRKIDFLMCAILANGALKEYERIKEREKASSEFFSAFSK